MATLLVQAWFAAQRSAAAVPDDARLGSAAAGREVGGGDRGRAGADGIIYVIHRCFANSCAGRMRSADPEVRRERQAARSSWGAGHVRLPARRHGRSRRQPVGDRRARRERQGTSGLQVQPGRQGADDARQGGRQRLRPGSVRSAHRRRRRAERRHLRHRQPSQRQEQPRRAVHEGRQVRQGVGHARAPAAARSASRTRSRWTRAGGCSSATARTTASRSSIRTASSLDEWRQFGRPSGIFITSDDTIYVADSESGPDTGAHELPGIKKGIRIGSAKDGRSPRSSKIRSRRRRITPAPKASASTRRGTSTAPSSGRQMLERHTF